MSNVVRHLLTQRSAAIQQIPPFGRNDVVVLIDFLGSRFCITRKASYTVIISFSFFSRIPSIALLNSSVIF